MIAPVVLSTNSSATETTSNMRKLDANREILAATTSLQSGHGPLGIGPMSCSAGGLGSAYCKTAQRGQASSTSGADGSWTSIIPSIPSPRFFASMVYDAADGYVVLSGGAGGSGVFFGDTWRFLGGSWTDITPSSSPSPRDGASMAYDAADGYVILFGGVSSGALLGDTWKFSVPGFSASAIPSSLSIERGTNATIVIRLASVGGFSGKVNLTATITPATSKSPGIALSPTSLTLPAGGTASSTLTVTPVHSPKGDGAYVITVTATSGSITHTITISLTVTKT